MDQYDDGENEGGPFYRQSINRSRSSIFENVEMAHDEVSDFCAQAVKISDISGCSSSLVLSPNPFLHPSLPSITVERVQIQQPASLSTKTKTNQRNLKSLLRLVMGDHP